MREQKPSAEKQLHSASASGRFPVIRVTARELPSGFRGFRSTRIDRSLPLGLSPSVGLTLVSFGEGLELPLGCLVTFAVPILKSMTRSWLLKGPSPSVVIRTIGPSILHASDTVSGWVTLWGHPLFRPTAVLGVVH